MNTANISKRDGLQQLRLRTNRCHHWIAALFSTWALACALPPVQAQVPPNESDVLQALYIDTVGDSWTHNDNWTVAGRFNVGHECSWYGISCDPGLTHVLGISLVMNNLTGSFPSLRGLAYLQTFNISQNSLPGPIPSLAGLANLQQFYAGGDLLSGSIPSLTGLISLEAFGVPDNQLTGSIPSLAGLTYLEAFGVPDNQLTGSIPSLAGLTLLSYFDVSQNQLTGSIGFVAQIDCGT